MALKVGEVVGGKYEILKEIGHGGMSVVYLAMDKNLNKQWAVKEVKRVANDSKNEIVVQSLLAEANLMKKLDHPNLPRIVDIIETGETLFVVMDYIEGESLEKIVKVYGPQPEEVVIDWAKQLCNVLGYLHNQTPPIIYRDMKPANVMLKPEGTLKVIDFGIAREYKIGNSQDTTNLGTRGYAAPEQYETNEQTDPRTDIYCLGVTLHHLLTGRYPDQYPYELVPIRDVNPSLSGGLERIIINCTQKNPENRYQSCDELLYDLEHYEEVDDAYKKRQKGKLKTFIISASICLLMLIVGISSFVLAMGEKQKSYESKINVASSTNYEDKVNSYKEAIGLIGDDVRAYIKLLDAYKDNGVFAEKESNEFTALFNANINKFDQNSAEYKDLNFQIGVMYFYVYSGDDNSFRTRILKSYPYFSIAAKSEGEEYENSKLAESYYIVGKYYNDFVVNQTSQKEPSKEVFEELFEAIDVCIRNMDEYENDDSAFISLTMYQSILNLMNTDESIAAFRNMGIPKEDILNIMNLIYDKTNEIYVIQQNSLSIKNKILSDYPIMVENIERMYRNSEEN